MCVSDTAEKHHALVTGASSGIGRAIAMALLQDGMHVHLLGRDMQRLESVAANARHGASILQADLTDSEALTALANGLGPRLHVLVHSAGAYARGEPHTMSPEQLSALDSVNVQAPLRLTMACLPMLRAASGQVVFVNSSAALHPSAANTAYAAGKQALRTAVDKLRQDLNPYGIRVLSIFPGRTDTPMQQEILRMEQRTAPPGSLMRPEDVALMIMAALRLPPTAEVTDIMMRPMRPM
jgi:NADP-dependent 3-hydroxy acid dehydrogenase YdfG